MLQGAEGRLAVLGEDVRDRAPRTLLDHLVAIGERQLEPGGEQGPDRGLARTHEADEDDHGDSGLPWAGVVPSTGSAGSGRPGSGAPVSASAGRSAVARRAPPL